MRFLVNFILIVITGFCLIIISAENSFAQSAFLTGPPPASGKKFITLPPGSILPSDSECQSRLRRTAWEPRPENNILNNYIPTKGQDYSLIGYSGTDRGIYIGNHAQLANALIDRTNGNFKGTTDEIIQWTACKWGLDEDMARAQAVVESNWQMSANGDGGDSFGLLQVRKSVFTDAFPASQKSTAFNADYAFMRWRICFEGLIDYLAEGGTGYVAGDAYGCMGTWYTGNWYGDGGGYGGGAVTYINAVKSALDTRTWEQWEGTILPSTSPVSPSVTPSTLPVSISPSPQAGKPGDANNDGNVDGVDYVVWLNHYNQQTSGAANGDFDNNNYVDGVDYVIWLNNYGK